MSDLITRLTDLNAVGDMRVEDLLDDMGALASHKVAITVCDGDDFTAIGGLVCLHGPHTDRYIAAIEAVNRGIEREEENDSAQ